MVHAAAEDRYESMTYRRCGRRGLQLPAISLGLWQNFGEDRAPSAGRAIVLRAFDLGITHFDLANNYGPPPGAAEQAFGRILSTDLAPYRDELVIATKAGYDMWPGPYGTGGSRKYVLDSLDQSLRRMGVDHVDVFYSHRFDPDVPLDETMGALTSAVEQGKARYAAISSYSAARTRDAAALLADARTPMLLHQPSYSMLNRWVEDGLLDAVEEVGAGCICFSLSAQGLLTDRYLDGVPDGSRASRGGPFRPAMLREENIEKVRGLSTIARRRGQSLAQMAVAWVLRQPVVTSALVGASSVAQLEELVGALANLDFADAELAEIDRYATEGDVNIWSRSSAS